MKKLLSILLLLPFAVTAQNGTFSINGKVNRLKNDDKVYLSYYNYRREQIIDSSAVNNGEFKFTGSVIEPVAASLFVNARSRVEYNKSGKKDGLDFLGIYIEPAELTVTATDSLKYALISGGSVNADEAKLAALIKPTLQKWMAYYNRSGKLTEEQKKDKKISSELEEEEVAIWEEEMRLKSSFVQANPTSFISLELLQKLIDIPEYFAIHRTSFDAFSPAMKATPTGRMTGGRLGVLERLANLKTAIDFELNDVDGKPVKLSDFKGKYVLIDFWASWCGPCRRENPNVLANYEKYKDKGFTVLGISLDTDKNAWKKAVVDDKLTWIQVCDQTGPQSAAGKYGVASIPTNFLIDPTGKILASKLRDKNLGVKLEEIFSGK